MSGPGILLPGGETATEEDLGRKTYKRLLVAVPTAPKGSVATELWIWTRELEAHSLMNELGREIASKADSLTGNVIAKTAERFACAYSQEQLALLGINPKLLKEADTPLLPPHWSVVVLPIQGRPIPVNRNNICRLALWRYQHADKEAEEPERSGWVDTDFDAVLMLDDDIVPKRLDLHFLLDAIDNGDDEGNEVDLVSAMYCMDTRDGPCPILYQYNDDYSKATFDPESLIAGERGLRHIPRGALPAGALLIKRHVLQRFWDEKTVWFKDRICDCSFEGFELNAILESDLSDGDKLKASRQLLTTREKRDYTQTVFGEWSRGEDIYFFRQCHRFKFRIYIDTRLHWGHTKPVDLKDFFNMREMWYRRGFAEGQGAYKAGRRGKGSYEQHQRMNSRQRQKRARAEEEARKHARKFIRGE